MKGKKLLAGVLSAAMVLGTVSFSAFADGETTEPVTYTDSESKTVTYQKVTDTDGNITISNETIGSDYAVAEYEIDGKSVSFKGTTLRSVNNLMRAYWEVNKTSSGCDYNSAMLPANGTGDLEWKIYGTVTQGEYLNSGALILPSLSGGYIWGSDGGYDWKSITVAAGTNNATIVSSETFNVEHTFVANGKETTAFTGIRFNGGFYAVPHSNMTFDACTFTGRLRTPNGDGEVTVNECTFTGEANEPEYAFFYQASGKLNFTNNTIVESKYERGLNLDNKDLEATVSGNIIGKVTDQNRSAVQISGIKKIDIERNNITIDGGNVFTLHNNLYTAVAKPEVTIKDNTISGNGYLFYDDAKASGNTFDENELLLVFAGNIIESGIDKKAGKDKTGALVPIESTGYLATRTESVAKIGDKEYTTLKDAVAAAQDGDTIDLLDNTIELDGQTTIDKDVTITNGTFNITGANCTTEGIIYIDNKTVEFNNVDFVGSNFTSAFGVIFANHNADVTLYNCDFTLKNDRAPLGGTLKGNDNASFTVKNCTFDLENPSRVLTNIKLDMSDTTINAYVTDSTRVAGDLNNHAFRNVYGKIKDSTIDVTGTETGLKNTDSGSLLITGKSNVSFTNTVDANIYLNDENEILTVEPPANVIGDIVYETVSERVLTDKITVNFVPTANENVYDIVLDGNYKEIYKFVSAEIQFVNAGNGYEIDGTDDSNVSPTTENDDRYGFYLKDGTLDNRITATKIKIGTVTFPAYGTINFKVDANNSKVVATEYNTHHEKYYTEADANAKLPADENGINSTIAAPSIPVGSGGTGAVSFIVDFRTNGGSIVSSVKVKKGEKVIRPEDPTKEGYTFGGWFTDEALKKEYDFDTKVQKKLVLYAKWIEEAAVEPEPELPVFTDVKETDWFYESVMTAFKKGLMNGVSETEFAPDTTLTRAMLVTILYRAEGEPATNRSIPFADIEMGSYYANAVIWAAQNGIVNGTTETTFAPDSNITREQVAAILYRYAIYKGMDAVDLSENLNFADSDDVSEYAISALNWATGCGLVTGYEDNTLRPLANTTRAEAATLLQRFIETDK